MEIVGRKMEEALVQIEPVEALRQLVIDLQRSGMDKAGSMREFYAFNQRLRAEGRDREADLVEDVLDMMTGWYVGRNLD